MGESKFNSLYTVGKIEEGGMLLLDLLAWYLRVPARCLHGTCMVVLGWLAGWVGAVAVVGGEGSVLL